MKTQIYILIFIFGISKSFSQNINDSIKTGFTFGGIPVVAFDTDLGLKTGIALNIFHFGNGENYPKHNHSLLLKWYRTTKKSSLSQIIYDTEKLIPNVRLTTELTYSFEKTMDFYGFNGSKTFYNPLFIDASNNNPYYISKVYYKHQRKLLRFKSDFQGKIKNTKLNWLLGFSHYNVKIQSVDIDYINERKETKILLPDTAILYEKYINWNIIDDNEKNGGINNFFKLGFIYDSRDKECNCNSGIWSEALIIVSPSFNNEHASYGKLLITHRQYFPIKFNKLIFAYRVSYQTKIWGTIPFYMLPFFIDTKRTEDGIGGAKTLRGIMRNRIVSDGFALANIELRWRFLSFKLFKQNFDFTLNGFTDFALITNEYEINTDFVTSAYGLSKEDNLKSLNFSSNNFHISYGVGLYIIMNHNFAISTDYGKAFSKQDGYSSLYIGLDYLF